MAGKGRKRVESGPFDVFIHPGTDNRHLNFAIGREAGSEEYAAAVDGLVAVFEQEGRLPRLEVIEEAAPGLSEVLERAGFEEELSTPVMTSTPEQLARPEPLEGLTFERVEPGADPALVRTLLETQRTPFGADADHVSDADVQRFAEGGSQGGSLLARLGGEPVAAGVYTAPGRGLSELAGIGVLEAHRRKGIGALITAALGDRAFGDGAELAFLTPGSEATARVYERAGFRSTLTARYWNLG